MSISLLTMSNKESIYCDIKGNVYNPGVYEVKENYTIRDVINDAGGLKDNSYTDKINLSKKVIDEMVIYIPTKYEINKLNELNNCDCSKYVVFCKNENNIESEEILNNSITTTKVSDNNLQSTTTKKKIESTTTKKVSTTTTSTTTITTTKEIKYPININDCNLEDLLTIKGLGEVKAKKIIEYREVNGIFKNVEDIKNVSGIGDVLFNRIKEFITI